MIKNWTMSFDLKRTISHFLKSVVIVDHFKPYQQTVATNKTGVCYSAMGLGLLSEHRCEEVVTPQLWLTVFCRPKK